MNWFFNLIKILERVFGKNMETLKVDDNTPEWYKVAVAEIGIKEVVGGENPRIIEYHSTTSLKAEEDEIAWCSAFVNWCFKKCAIEGTNSAMARSWLNWGQEVKEPYKGCVVVLKRGTGWQGHVGFMVEKSGSMIGILGGNQNDSVSIAYFSMSKILGFREPKSSKE